MGCLKMHNMFIAINRVYIGCSRDFENKNNDQNG